ncbi:VrrA/YqfQ family protein [Geobacillus thermocatenulatus]|uniref:VrrA/YqfQ family protein n=1 Tax=Geobacillus thermocatenulatus TaxID=33938 RepID=UPI0004732FE2|nr:VrrA/YqfQ family protein [Geobacillus thermocatenulatus]
MRYSRPPMMPSPFAGRPPAPFTRMPTPPFGPSGPGGFLARLFSRGQPPAAASSPWGLPFLPNAASTAASNTGGGLVGMLNNVQKMLGIAQNVMPMVQQYGPLIRNLPAMIRIFRELKPADEGEGETTSKSAPANETKQKPAAKAPKKRSVPQAKREEPQEKEASAAPKPSKPKLYI